MKQIIKIEKCNSVVLVKEHLFYITNRELLVICNFDQSTIELVTTLSKDGCKLIGSQYRLFIVDSINRIIGEVTDFKLIEVEPQLVNLRVIGANDNHLYVYVKKPVKKRGTYDLKCKHLNFLTPEFNVSYIFKNTAYCLDNCKILQYDCETGQKRNTFDLTTNFTIQTFERILGINKERIFIIMSDGAIVSVNTETQQYQRWKSFYKEYLSYKTSSTEEPISIMVSELGNYSKRSATFLYDRHKIIGFEYGVYWELDLKTNILKAVSMFEEFKVNQISGCWSSISVKNNVVYFFSDQAFNKNQSHKLISFDMDKKEVLDQWGLKTNKLERKGFVVSGPIVLNSKIIAAFEQNSTCHLINLETKKNDIT